MPISIPVIDMVEIGAGGGSLAPCRRVAPDPRWPAERRVRAGARLLRARRRRGRRSRMRTCCWARLDRRTGSRAARSPLDRPGAEDALRTDVGEPLGMDAATAAFGVSEVVDENMANAARVHAVENGEDLAGYTMIAFGGAAPLHAGRLCEKLGIRAPAGAAGRRGRIGDRLPARPVQLRGDALGLHAAVGVRRGAVRALLDALRAEATAFVRGCDAGAEIASQAQVLHALRGAGMGDSRHVDARSRPPTRSPRRSRRASRRPMASSSGARVAGADIEVDGLVGDRIHPRRGAAADRGGRRAGAGTVLRQPRAVRPGPGDGRARERGAPRRHGGRRCGRGPGGDHGGRDDHHRPVEPPRGRASPTAASTSPAKEASA